MWTDTKIKKSSGSFKNVILKMCLEIIYLIYMYRKDRALHNQPLLICHKTKPNKTKPNKFTNPENIFGNYLDSYKPNLVVTA